MNLIDKLDINWIPDRSCLLPLLVRKKGSSLMHDSEIFLFTNIKHDSSSFAGGR